jgi:hypothetical protein
VKFYTGEGTFDLVGNNIPVFFIRGYRPASTRASRCCLDRPTALAAFLTRCITAALAKGPQRTCPLQRWALPGHARNRPRGTGSFIPACPGNANGLRTEATGDSSWSLRTRRSQSETADRSG